MGYVLNLQRLGTGCSAWPGTSNTSFLSTVLCTR